MQLLCNGRNKNYNWFKKNGFIFTVSIKNIILLNYFQIFKKIAEIFPT